MSNQVRTRFAPSPTGSLHIGGARTALFNWLYARKHGGAFILRVEDTDKARNKADAHAGIYSGLKWLGMNADEGPNEGGNCGPYNQSERQEIYEKWFQKLVTAGRGYEDDGAWRFRFDRKPVTVTDLVCGEITIDYTDESINPDMTVKRSNGDFVFHFVNVVDDIEMKMTHVIRGEDHLMNTPKHLQLYEAFGVEPPKFAHIPLILNPDGSKMSKRDQGAALKEYTTHGYLPEAVNNYIALLGWSPKGDKEIFSMSELVENFGVKFDSTPSGVTTGTATGRFLTVFFVWRGVGAEEEFFGATGYDILEGFLVRITLEDWQAVVVWLDAADEEVVTV